MLNIEIDLIPIPWKSHAGFGRRSFNPRFREKEQNQWLIRSQYKEPPITSPVSITYTFHMPMPKASLRSKARRAQMLAGKMHHIVRPDLTNLIKYQEDCLKGIVIEDDSQVCEMIARKVFSDHPKTVIQIKRLNLGTGV